MTHLPQSTRFGEAIQLLTEHGFEGLAEVLQLLLNEVMKLERCEVLGAAPYERTADRQGYANGFKDKSVRTRVGDLHLKGKRSVNLSITHKFEIGLDFGRG